MSKLNQAGFSLVEVLIVFVVIAVISGAGLFVWKQRDTEKPKANTQNTASAPAKTTVDYTATDTGFTFKAPADWEKTEGRGVVVTFKAPKTDTEGATSWQARIQAHSEDYSGTLAGFAAESAAAARIPTQEVSNRQVSEESSSTSNGVSTSSFELTYTLTYDNTNVHCLDVMHVGKGKALSVSACSLASKWDDYKKTFMDNLLGYSY